MSSEETPDPMTNSNNPSAVEDEEAPKPNGKTNGPPASQPYDRQNTYGTSATGETTEVPLFQFLTGMKEDLRARVPLYKDDWKRPRSLTTVFNATIFAFVIQLIPALIFAELIDRETEGHIATAETLLSTGIMGVIYAIFAGQPLVIMGVTGPVALLLGTSFGLTETFDAEYFPFFFWICLWAGIMHIISAMCGLVSLVWKVTPFTSQIFELFIAITFIFSSVKDLIEPLNLDQGEDLPKRPAEYAALIIGLVTFNIAWSLHFAETWAFFSRNVRAFLTSYNTLIALVVGTALSYIPGVDQTNSGGGIDRVAIRFTPWDWQPTWDRDWFVSPFDGIDAKGILAALIPGFMFFLLFIIDHNVSSILTQSSKFNLKKPPAYHWDFFVLGLTFLPCAFLGLPPGNGLIPQAPLHGRALCTREFQVDRHGVKREIVTYCEEQRYSPLGQALLMFVALASFELISWIPKGCLFGLFFYLGVGALHGNEIWERVLLSFMVPKHRPAIPIVRNVPWRITQLWTFIQVCCAGAIFAVGQFTSVGYIYPALLVILVPFRSYILERYFEPEHLKHLDPFGESEDEFHEEQRKIQLAFRQGSFDEEEVAFPTRAEFHGQGMKRALRNRHRRHTIGHHSDNILAVDFFTGSLSHMKDTERDIGLPAVQVITPSLHPDPPLRAASSISASLHKD